MEEPFLRRGGIVEGSERDLLVEQESHRQGGVMVRWTRLRWSGLEGGESTFLGLVVVICWRLRLLLGGGGGQWVLALSLTTLMMALEVPSSSWREKVVVVMVVCL